VIGSGATPHCLSQNFKLVAATLQVLDQFELIDSCFTAAYLRNPLGHQTPQFEHL